MKIFIKAFSLGLYIVTISASLSMAAVDRSEVNSKNCPQSLSIEENNMILNEVGIGSCCK